MAPRRTKRRREKGSGSVTYDKTRGKYVARLPDSGIGTPPKKQFDTEAEADAWLDGKLRDMADGIATRDIPHFGPWIDHCHANVWKVRATTHEDYGDIIRVRITPHLGRFGLDELERSPETIELWLNQLEKEGYAFNSIRNAFRLVRAALKVAVARDKIRKNPTDSITLRTPDDVDDGDSGGYALAPSEARRFLDAVEGHWLYALYYTALRTGMRQAELIGLRRVNVQLAEKNGKQPRIYVREQIRDVSGVPTVFRTKNKKNREIPIDDDLIAVLTAHLALVADERERRGKEWIDRLLMFPSTVGTPLGHNNLRRHFRAALRHAGLPRIRFHDLRHSAGSLMLRNGGTLVDVSRVLGHSDIAVTARIYIHSYEDTMFAAVAGTATTLRRAGGEL